MKRLLLALTLLLTMVGFSAATASAQKVKFDDGIVTVDGVPYMRLTKNKQGLAGFANWDIANLAGKPLGKAVYFSGPVMNDFGYAIHFDGRTDSVMTKGEVYGMAKWLGTKFYESRVIVKDSLSQKGIDAFAAANSNYVPAPPVVGPDFENHEMVVRNRNQAVRTSVGRVEQGFDVIGKVSASVVIATGKDARAMTFTFPDGTLVAEATLAKGESSTWVVVTAKDNRTHNTYIRRGGVNDNDAATVATFLVKNMYL